MDEHQKKHKLVAESLIKESDRGCVILGAALLTEALETLIRSVCRDTPKDIKSTIDPLFQGYAPLATFSARIQMAFALGILPRSLRDKIEIVRRMRNDFAHQWGPIDFNDPRCANRLNLLIRPSESEREEELQQETLKGLAILAPTKEQLVTRIAFTLAVHGILGGIDKIVEAAMKGYDVRPIVRRMETERLWEGPT
jgi:DNA-binding MltR family transcriptional regulator